jgi:hypothetical protein
MLVTYVFLEPMELIEEWKAFDYNGLIKTLAFRNLQKQAWIIEF